MIASMTADHRFRISWPRRGGTRHGKSRELVLQFSCWSLCAAAVLAQPVQATDTPVSAFEETSVRQERYLGVVTEPVSAVLAAQFKGQLPSGYGLVVLRLLPDSPAAKAGIQPFDILTKANDQMLASPDELKKVVVKGRQQTEVRLELLREGKLQTLQVLPGFRTVSRLVHRFADGHGQETPERHLALRKDPAAEQTDKPPLAFSVSVETKDVERYEVEVSLFAEDKEFRTSGSLVEIKAQIKPWPAQVRNSVMHQIGRMVEDRGMKAVKFRFQARTEDPQQLLAVTLRKPQPNGGMKSFELFQPMGPDKGAVALELLLDAPSFKNQLQDLDPAVREKIESTLKQTVLQPATVKMELSQ